MPPPPLAPTPSGAPEPTGRHRLFTAPVYDDEGNVKGSPPPDEPTDVPQEEVEAAKQRAEVEE